MSQPMHDKVCPLRGGQHAHERSVENLLSVPSTPTLANTGAQYVSVLLSRTMREHGIRPSMGAVRSPWDNAAMESLMGTIKSEAVHARVYDSREEAELDLFEYIECIYNRVRIHSALGYMSPVEFEKANWPKEGKCRLQAE